MKNAKVLERFFRGSSQWCILKSPDMKLPADMQSFLRNGVNKVMVFNLTEVTLKVGKQKIAI